MKRFHIAREVMEIPFMIESNGKVLWVNSPEGCVLRICGIPDNSILSIDKKGFVDITIQKVGS